MEGKSALANLAPVINNMLLANRIDSELRARKRFINLGKQILVCKGPEGTKSLNMSLLLCAPLHQDTRYEETI